MESLWLRFKQRLWFLECKTIRRWWCFVVGHDIKHAPYIPAWGVYEPDWCGRCYQQEGAIAIEECWTIPVILERAYRWLVDNGGEVWEKIDLWLCVKLGKWLPRGGNTERGEQ